MGKEGDQVLEGKVNDKIAELIICGTIMIICKWIYSVIFNCGLSNGGN